jgi:hypothetical protein
VMVVEVKRAKAAGAVAKIREARAPKANIFRCCVATDTPERSSRKLARNKASREYIFKMNRVGVSGGLKYLPETQPWMTIIY